MTWEEFVTGQTVESRILSDYEKTDIECPECGSLIYKNCSVVLACCPPKHWYRCVKCEWKGFA